MASRTVKYTQMPWDGGINTAVDPGAIPVTDLQQADNVQFDSSGLRIRREGFDYFGSTFPTLLARASSGTTRTLYFSGYLQSSTDDILVNGEKIVLTTTAANGNEVNDYVGNFTVASVTTVTPSAQTFTDSNVNITTDQITITAHGFYTGLPIKFTTTGGLPGGLTAGTEYYVVEVDANTIKVALTLAAALAGTVIDLTSNIGGGTHTGTPQATTNGALTYTASGSLTEGATSTSTLSIARDWTFIGGTDYWYVDASNVKQQLVVAISNEPKWYQYTSGGHRKEIAMDAGATALSSPTIARFETMNERLIVSFDGTANTPKKYFPVDSANWQDLGGSPPNFEFCRMHLGRLFANNKANKDRLEYTSPGNHEEWGGVGDSGAIDIQPGDGDPTGIIGISPEFRGSIFIGKSRKIVELEGDTPETFQETTFDSSLGFMSHDTLIPTDLNDVLFMSSKGFHSLMTTAEFGDFTGEFLSAKIQPTFNDWYDGTFSQTRGVYLPNINSVAFNITATGHTTPTELWLVNTDQKKWYRWPNIQARALWGMTVGPKDYRPMVGIENGQLIRGLNGSFIDFGTSNISYTIKSGAIYPDQNPYTLKAFKRIALYIRPKGDITITLNAYVDNLPVQTTTITTEAITDLLGSTFILGQSILGISGILAPESVDIMGVGRQITIEVVATSNNQPVEIYGFMIEYEPVGTAEETT